MKQRRSVCLVAGGLSERNHRLQPWRYLLGVAAGLREQGHQVTIISDAVTSVLPDNTLQVKSVASPMLRPNRALLRTVARINAQVTLWHVGLASFLYQRYPCTVDQRNIGIFTSPIYRPADFYRIGIRKTLKNYALSAVHLATAFTPYDLLRVRMQRSGLDGMVVQTQTTRQQLRDYGLWLGQLQVIPPGLDDCWTQASPYCRTELRQALGFRDSDQVILFTGSPAPLRGLPTLIQAVQIARRRNPMLKLLVLSRRREDELASEMRDIQNQLMRAELAPHVRLVDNFLSQQDMATHMAAADMVALPFELVPSDAPLSLMEAAAMRKPVITTRLGCLPELVPPHLRFLAEPSNPASLAEQLVHVTHSAEEESIMPGIFRSWQRVGSDWSRFIQELP